MEKLYEVGLLIDFYGQLVTERQYEILDLYYNNDYSLGEIAELFGISRQGVYDNTKRGKELLGKYEKKLGLVKRFAEQKKKAIELLGLIDNIDVSEMGHENKCKLSTLRDGIRKIFEEL